MENNYIERKERVGIKLIVAGIFTLLLPYFGVPILLYKYFMGRNRTSKKGYNYEYETEVVRDKRFKGGYREQLGNQKKVAVSQEMSGYEQENYDKKIKGYLYIAIGVTAFYILLLATGSLGELLK